MSSAFPRKRLVELAGEVHQEISGELVIVPGVRAPSSVSRAGVTHSYAVPAGQQ